MNNKTKAVNPNNFSDMQNFIFNDKYAKWDWDKNKRETFTEAIDRSIAHANFMVGNKLTPDEYAELKEGMLSMAAFPSLRYFQTAGVEATRHPQSMFNCSFLPVIDFDCFAETLFLLGLGVGVGYSVENKFVKQLPEIPMLRNFAGNREIIFKDSLEGWAHGVRQAFYLWSSGIDPVFNFSELRPKGSPLKTRGGYSSGPEPFEESLEAIREIILGAAGRKLETIEAHDIQCHIASAIVSGGFRRSAMISLFDPTDDQMFNSKMGDWYTENIQRRYANNSFVVNREYSDQWWKKKLNAVFEGGWGEPGIFSRYAAQQTFPKRRQYNDDMGTNPCLVEGTMVQTKGGHYPIENLVGKEVEVWNGSSWQTVNNFRITGNNQKVSTIVLQNGQRITATNYHKFILEDGSRKELKDLVVGDKLQISEAPLTHGTKTIEGAYALGFWVGDGTINGSGNPVLRIYQPKYNCINGLINSLQQMAIGKVNTNAITEVAISEPVKNYDSELVNFSGLTVRKENFQPFLNRETGLPKILFECNLETKLEFLAGLFDADGTIIDGKNGFAYQFSSVYFNLISDVQLLLKTVGIDSKLKLNKKAGKKDFGKRGGTYNTKNCYRLTISQSNSINLSNMIVFERLPSFADREVKYSVKPKWNEIVAIENSGIAETVYCCTVEGNHQFSLSNGLDVGQCGEVILNPFQFCNLSIANVRPEDTFESLKQKVRLAAIWGTIQATADYFPGIRREWSANQIRERLLGVDLNGQMDNENFSVKEKLDDFQLEELKNYVNEVNAEYAKRFGIRPAAASTCGKPAGNSSLLFDTASGIGARHSEYYIRRVQVLQTSPMATFLKENNVPFENLVQDSMNTLVFDFPMQSPNTNAKFKGERSAVEQLEQWKQIKVRFTEHNPSVTIDYRQNEVNDVVDWIIENQAITGGLSFLPFDDVKYDNAPYEEIDKETYDRMVSEIDIDWKTYKNFDEAYFNPGREFACSGGSCEVL